MSYTKRKESDDDLLETFKGWFKQYRDNNAKQADNEKEDLQAQVGEFQWDEKARLARLGQDGSNPRPTLSISLTKQPMQLVKNQAANADLGVEIHPVSEKANKEIAEAKQGLYRAIERDSNAYLPRMWGFDRAVQCGRGYYQVVAVWDDEGDHPLDQKILIKRILDGSRVGLDPSAQEPDFSDARWGYLDDWMDYDAFVDEFPAQDLAKLSTEDFADLAANEPDWVMGGDAEKKGVRVPQVWRKKFTHRKMAYVLAGPRDKADEGGYALVPSEEVGSRKVFGSKIQTDITLCWYRICATGILGYEEYGKDEETGKPGLTLIPIIPIVWDELQPFDGQKRYQGMQRPARDGQKAFNFAISAAVEDVGRLSKVPYVGPAGAFAGFEEKWDTINVKNWSYVEYNLIGSDGQQIQRPEPMPIDGTKLGLSLQLAEMAKGLVQSATAVYDPSLGKTEGQHESGRKVLALQQQADAGTSNGVQGLAHMTLRYEAKVVGERMRYYYDRPGRVARIVGKEDKERTIMLGAHYITGEDGRPQRVEEGTENAKFIDFGIGTYSESVTAGKSYQTKMQEGQEVWSNLLPNLPPEAQVILLPTVMQFMDTPGATDAAELMAKFRDAKFPGLVDNEENGPTPEQLKSQLAGLQQQMQMQGQQLQMAIQKIETDFAKQQATMMKAQMDAQTTMHKTEMDNAAKIAVAQINAESKGLALATEAQNEALATGLQAREAEAAREHERRMQHETLAHDAAKSAAGANEITMSRDQGQNQEGEQTNETSQGASQESTSGAETAPEPQADGAGE